MSKKAKWAIVAVVLLTLIGGGVYFFVKKKYYPKVEDVSYLKLDLTKDTAQVKAGVRVQNNLPLPISIDSIRYTLQEEGAHLGWGSLISKQTLPALGEKELDFKMLLNFDKYRKHLQDQQGKDSLKLEMQAEVFFDLPLLSPMSISLNRNLSVPVPKAPAMQLRDVVVKSFSVDSGYTFLLQIDATNQNLPDLKIQNFQYKIRIDESLTLEGQVDTTFYLQKGDKLLEIPLSLKTSDAVALLEKVLSGDMSWAYYARVDAQLQSSHKILGEFRLTVEKDGTLAMGKMGSRDKYMPTLKQINRLNITSDEETTLLQAAVVVHNPAPIPFYIDSASYFIRHNGKVIASGKKDFETILKKSGDNLINLRLLVVEQAYEQLMKEVQGQENINLDIALNLLYNLPNAERQRIQVSRQVQVPVPGQSKIQVKGLAVRELSPQKGAHLSLKLQVQSSNLPEVSITNLDYTLKLGDDLTITGSSQQPITVGGGDNLVEVPLHLSAENVNLLLDKALKGNMDWNYDLEATATLKSPHKMIGPTKVNLAFTGELEMGKGGMGKQFVPHITKVDTLDLVINYDTAWVKLKIHVKNPLPVAFNIDSLLLTVSHPSGETSAYIREGIGKILPAEGTQSAWVTLQVNYSQWREYVYALQGQDSLRLQETITLVYQLEDLAQQRTTFQANLNLPTPEVPVTELKKVKPQGFSFTKGIILEAQVLVKNLNLEKLLVKNPSYNACVANLLDVCGTINRTYQVPQGKNTVLVPMSLGLGEMFRAFFAKLSGKGKSRPVYLSAEAMVETNSPLLQNTFVKLKIWKMETLFPNKKQKSPAPATQQTARKN